MDASRSTRRRVFPALALLVVVAGAIVAYFVWPKKKVAPKSDLVAATQANTRGVGHMERFEFPEAQKTFEEAVRLAPDWLTARINLGIAQFNQQQPGDKTISEHLASAKKTFNSVLADDANNPYAHYCLGIIAYFLNEVAEAYGHFVMVRDVDANDPHTWLRIGMTHPDGERSPAAIVCFETALKLDPYMNEARYRLARAIIGDDQKRGEELLNDHKKWLESDQFTESRIQYAEMGKYADIIGRDVARTGKPSVGPLPTFASFDGFQVTLAPGTRWATAADLSPIVKAARERFGGTIVAFDYNRDGKPDLLLLSAVVQNDKVRDLLLRNDGAGKFSDQTAAAGLDKPRPSLGAAVGDYDNDGFLDFMITGAGEQHVFRNTGDGKFVDVSEQVGVASEKGVCLGCGWVDIDADCDLDLILCRYASSIEKANNFQTAPNSGGGLLVCENIGVARPMPPNSPMLPLTTAFKSSDAIAKLVGPCSPVAFLLGDLDGDRDLDMLVLRDAGSPIFVANDRLMRFHIATPDWSKERTDRWTGGLVFTAAHSERSDVFLTRTDGAPTYLLATGRDLLPATIDTAGLKQAGTIDLDLDGWPDVVALGVDGTPQLLHNEGDGKIVVVPNIFGTEGLDSTIGVSPIDLDGDCYPDLLVWREGGLTLRRNMGNGNKALFIEPTGRRDKGSNLRTNADGIGCRIIAQSGSHWTASERTTLSAGMGQSLLPTLLGMGKSVQADVVRIRWPDAVIQAELSAGTCSIVRISETNRKGTSCPVLMTWDGEKFVFVTDFLGGGALGESGPDGSVRPPRSEESVKIESGQLVVKNGQYVLKIAEPMDEVLYLDHLRLDVIDHPADVSVYLDERFVFADPLPTQELLAFSKRHFPKKATDHRGVDVTTSVLKRDRRAADTFALRSWLGYAEDHELILDFDDLPEAGSRRWFLVMAGWTEYPYPESMYAATRAGVPLQGPVLERLVGKEWKAVCDLGFPAGLPRVMTRELPANAISSGKYRIRTNMQIYCDQIFLAATEPIERIKQTTLNVSRADLANRGFMQEIHPDGRLPVAYDDSKTEAVAVTRWKGNLTRLGDVTELVTAVDDRFVLCGPGDEITVRFDAKSLPPLPTGWQRSFVLRTHGYCKDTSTTTVTGGEVGPLPFRAMPNYPDFGNVQPPATDAARWHTRPASGK